MKNVVGADAPRNLSATADGVVVDTLLKGDAAGSAVGLAEIVFAVFERESHFSVFNDVTEEDIKTPDFDESKLRSRMPDMRLDMVRDAECYAVASDELPLERANLIARKGDMVFGVYILEETVTYSDVPEEFAQNIPVGDGWDYKVQEGELHFLSELTEARVSAAETSEETSEPEQTEIPKMNNAELLGEDHPEMQELLQRPAVFMTGDLYGQKDRRNTLDGDWKRVKLPWLAWLSGEDKGKQSWGLTRHPEHKSKEGPSIVLADAIDGARKDAAIKTMYAVGLDIDSGAALDAVVKKLQEKGLFAIVYSSFRHKTTNLVLKHDDIIRKLKLDESPNRAQIQTYLRGHHKDRYDEDFIQSIEVVELRQQTPDGLRTVLKTRPLDKFRVILPLWEPVELANLGATVNQWKDVWADAVTGVAVNMLGVSFDATSTDVNRLFFTPRHKAGSEYYCAVIQGRPLRFEEIEPYSKARYVKERDPGDPFATAGGDVDTGKRERFVTPNGKDLNKWHTKYKDRWLAADVIESYAPDKIREAGGEKAGTVHLECPFEHEHSTEGGTATMAMNPDENEAGYWTVFCRHDACNGRDKLEFLQEILAQGWFDEELLWDDAWLIPLPDEEEVVETAEDGTPKTPDEIAAAFTNMTPEADLRKFMRKQIKMKADATTADRLISTISARTGIRKPDIRKMWGEEVGKLRNEAPQDAKSDVSVVNRDDYADQVKHALKGLKEAHEKEPKLFRYGTEIGRISRVPETGEVSIDIVKTVEGMRAEINKVASYATAFKTSNGDEGLRGTSCPKDVAGDIYSGGHDLPLPFLRRTVNYPLFDADLNLLRSDGYHPSAHLYMHLPDALDLPDVPENPSDEERAEAKRIIVQELAGDFPFDGYTRRELEVACGVSPPNPGEAVLPVPPSFLSFVAFLLQTMTRPVIGPNPMPALFVTKPESGTGASLLVELAQMIAVGETSTRPAFPTNEEERRKALFSTLRSSAAFLIIDNITGELDSPVLASFLTSRMFTDRVLGRNDERSVPNDVSAALTGNNPVATKEILRRLSLCCLDAQTEHPDLREGFRHDPENGDSIETWVQQNRGRILWALAVLVMNWKVKGCKAPSGTPLKSFADWYRVTGGIIEAAGWEGFQTNRDVLYDQSGSGGDDPVLDLIAKWFDAACKSDNLFDLPLEGTFVSDLAEFATALDMSLPDVRRKKNPEGDVAFDSGSLGTFLTKNKGRVFSVGSALIKLKKGKRASQGQKWELEVLPGKEEGTEPP